MIESVCRLEEFNRCPGADAFEDTIDEEYDDLGLKFVDIDYEDGWTNDGETAVFTFKSGTADTHDWVKFTEFLMEFRPDQYDCETFNRAGEDDESDGREYVFRMWWD